jgi:1-acyl-sn-glycerol-3-phosphate acyltransferase
MLRRLYYICACFVSWPVFGAGCLALNAGCFVLMCLPGRERRGPIVRETIRRLFSSWVGWLHATRMVTVSWQGEDLSAVARPMVCVANHPGMLDATLLLARLPDAVCILKPALLRNPFLAPAAIMAGYVSGDGGLDLFRELAGKVAAGRTLLIFPEGTRTDSGRALNPLKPGFALIAQRAKVPVQLVLVRTDRPLVPRGLPWWRVPQFPIRVEIRTGPRVTVDPARTSAEIAAEIQGIMAAELGLPS